MELRRSENVIFKTFLGQLHIIRDVTSVIYEKLKTVAPRVGEKENVAALRIAAQMIAYQSIEPIKVLTHVRRAGSHINPRRRSKPEHRLRLVQYGQ